MAGHTGMGSGREREMPPGTQLLTHFGDRHRRIAGRRNGDVRALSLKTKIQALQKCQHRPHHLSLSELEQRAHWTKETSSTYTAMTPCGVAGSKSILTAFLTFWGIQSSKTPVPGPHLGAGRRMPDVTHLTREWRKGPSCETAPRRPEIQWIPNRMRCL